MNLTELVTNLKIDIQAGERWAVIGPEVWTAASLLGPVATILDQADGNDVSELSGLLLFGALSCQADALDYLNRLGGDMNLGSMLVIVDWQADGPLTHGPPLEQRVKKGRVRRHLRETGFGVVETLDEHPLFYVVKGIKGPVRPDRHADQYIDVASLSDLPRNAMKKVELFGHRIVVANTGKEIVAFSQICPHANGLFDKGLLRGRSVVCPVHSYIWNVCTGEPVEPADEDTLRRYSVKIDANRNRVLVALAPP